MKCFGTRDRNHSSRRTPQGVRGLKFLRLGLYVKGLLSHPARGAWIEIPTLRTEQLNVGSHPARGAWIEIERGNQLQSGDQSHPARGAWIEITSGMQTVKDITSHPARGAWIEMSGSLQIHIAPRCRTPQGVRGLKFPALRRQRLRRQSHPARGAWIEIQPKVATSEVITVAPRKGCVD